MKYLLLIAVVGLLLWMARSGSRRMPPPTPKASSDGQPQDMVACVRCGVHLPRSEALPGRGGLFCGEDHRRDHESAHAGP